ncbi:WD40 repeat protein [Halopolyspora algeriensis]|uniref:WD40 repeat protein n=1 Tax=Halopolyspora algeriensis TaxID=1500506 RepID=A0A368VYD5_9ACTN|nr:TIR domain-containing protein [Halopolyspora algeriensis]RCW45842.1 WD40 repeat protein [Halopolyspora algeriensis]TQM55257.1 WD40 repeat protein [Halopolyspora algeriensis]
MAEAAGYDAFISYSHALDGKLAPTIQQELERFAKPWYRMRALRVFRDNVSLSASPGLWSSIERALAGSTWLVLMASPEAAQSPWVNHEVSWWLANRSPHRILLVVTSGEFVWDEQGRDVDRDLSTAVPPALHGAFDEEPRWVDMRSLRNAEQADRSNPTVRDCVADIAAAVRGVAKDEIVGEHIRHHRKAMWTAWSGVTALAIFLVLALVAWGIAMVQRNEARTQARIATARQLASTAVANLDTQLGLAQLLAVEAYRLDRSAQSRSALFQAVTASPHLVRQHPVGAPVTALASSRDGSIVVAGTRTGRLVRWDINRNASTEVTVGDRAVVDIAVDADGQTIAAADGSTTVLWDTTTEEKSTRPLDIEARSVALPPSGKILATQSDSGESRQPSGSSVLSLVDTRTGKQLHRKKIGWNSYGSGWDALGMPDDSTLALVGPSGQWRRFSMESLEESASLERPGFTPAGSFLGGFSQDASRFGYIKYGDITTTATRGTPEDGLTDTVNVPVEQPEHLIISNDGTYAAAAGGGAFHLIELRENTYELAQTGHVHVDTALTGHGHVDAITFLGNGPMLVSAADETLTLWNPHQWSRLSRGPALDMPSTSNAGGPPRLAVTSGAERIAVVSGDGDRPAVHDLSSAEPQRRKLDVEGRDLLPVWSADGSRLFLIGRGGAATVVTAGQVTARWPAAGDSPIIDGRVTADGERLVLVDYKGGVHVRDAENGQVVRTIASGSGIEEILTGQRGSAAVSKDARMVAVIQDRKSDSASQGSPDRFVTVIDTETEQSHQLPGQQASAVAFSSKNLLVQRDNGTLEVWDLRGTTKLRSFPGDTGYTRSLAPLAGTNLVARLRADGTTVIANLTSGKILGSFSLPPMTRGSLISPWSATALTSTSSGDLLTATSGGKLVRWRFDEAAWLRTACATAGRGLTAGEWRDIIGTEAPDDLTCHR